MTGTAPTARTVLTTCLNGVSGRTVTTGVVMMSLTVLIGPPGQDHGAGSIPAREPEDTVATSPGTSPAPGDPPGQTATGIVPPERRVNDQQIVLPCDMLLHLASSPVTRLHRVIAVNERRGEGPHHLTSRQ